MTEVGKESGGGQKGRITPSILQRREMRLKEIKNSAMDTPWQSAAQIRSVSQLGKAGEG